MQYNLFTLAFIDDWLHLEKDFLKFHFKESLRLIRISIVFGIVLYALFGVLDAVMVPNKKEIFWFIRYAVACPAALLILLFTFSRHFEKFVQIVLMTFCLLGGGSIELMGFLSDPPASHIYFAGIILVFIYIYTFCRMRFVFAFSCSWILVAFYEIGALWFVETPSKILIINTVFLVSANILCMAAGYAVELNARRSYFFNFKLNKEKRSVSWLNLVLDQKVTEKTADLTKKNDQLKNEISDRIKAQKDLKESEARFRKMVDELPIPVGETDFEFNIRYTNEAAREWFGFSQKDLETGTRASDIVPEDQMGLILDRMDKLQKGINPGPIELRLLKKDRSEIWGQITPTLIYEGKKPVGIRACFVDLTQRRKAEKATLFAAEQGKYAMVGQMAGKIANDFNNILGAIMGSTEASLKKKIDTSVIKHLKTILKQIKRGKLLTRNLVTFATDQEPKEEYIKLNDIIGMILGLQEKDTESVSLIKDFDPNLPELLADPGMIEQILANLFQNAIHAMSLVPKPELKVKTYARYDNIFFEIIDNGCGILERYHKEIYAPSFTLKGAKDAEGNYKKGITGTGYGLSNVKKYVDKHKGSIHFESAPGLGTMVTVSIPVIKKELTQNEKVQVAKQTIMKEKNILLVEDEKIIAKVQYAVLSKEPFYHQVQVAPDGEKAMALFAKDDFDLISLDYILPGKFDGLDVYHAIRKKNKTIPIVFVSGNIEFLASTKEMKDADRYLDFISKPCKNLTYANTVNHWLQ